MEEIKKIEVQYHFYLPDHRGEVIKFQYATDMMLALHEISELCWKARKNDTDLKVDQVWACLERIPLEEME